MPENNNEQTPFSLNQIEQEHPSVPRSFNLLSTPIAGSLNAGHNKVIFFREVMAGERIGAEGARMYIWTATPKTPALQKLRATVRVFKVPHERVMKNYAAFAAQSGGSSNAKIEQLPNFGGFHYPTVTYRVGDNEYHMGFQETTAYRDSFASAYLTRVGLGAYGVGLSEYGALTQLPSLEALSIRGFVAIYNDELRNKEYEPARQEFNGDTVSQAEFDSYIWQIDSDSDYYTGRCRRNNSYYTNYRTELQGYETETATDVSMTNNAEFALTWASFESQFNELRQQAANAQKNDWDIMQEIRGAKKLTQGRVEKLSERSFYLNYSAITQNAYNNNSEIEEKYRVMGFQGGYSFTDIDLTWLNSIEIIEDSFIHVILTVTAETVFESAVDRRRLNVYWKDRYRPNLKDDKLDVMYQCEMGTPYKYNYDVNYMQAIGFKTRYNEYFKLPTLIQGDLMNRGYFQSNIADSNESVRQNALRLESNSTYQFFEQSAYKAQKGVEWDSEDEQEELTKKIWLDYTDIMLNKNLAIPQKTYGDDEGGITLEGPNQIYYQGEVYSVVDMPIDEAAKNSFTKWGEH